MHCCLVSPGPGGAMLWGERGLDVPPGTWHVWPGGSSRGQGPAWGRAEDEGRASWAAAGPRRGRAGPRTSLQGWKPAGQARRACWSPSLSLAASPALEPTPAAVLGARTLHPPRAPPAPSCARGAEPRAPDLCGLGAALAVWGAAGEREAREPPLGGPGSRDAGVGGAQSPGRGRAAAQTVALRTRLSVRQGRAGQARVRPACPLRAPVTTTPSPTRAT